MKRGLICLKNSVINFLTRLPIAKFAAADVATMSKQLKESEDFRVKFEKFAFESATAVYDPHDKNRSNMTNIIKNVVIGICKDPENLVFGGLKTHQLPANKVQLWEQSDLLNLIVHVARRIKAVGDEHLIDKKDVKEFFQNFKPPTNGHGKRLRVEVNEY